MEGASEPPRSADIGPEILGGVGFLSQIHGVRATLETTGLCPWCQCRPLHSATPVHPSG